jgi:serine/threonine protein kinase
MLVETELHAKSSHHPNIVTYLDSFFLEKEAEFWVVLEFIDGCTLEGLLGLEKFKEPQMAHVTKCVTNALCYVHHMQRMHRDIKLGNSV